jgi:hypothetical protein
MQEQVESSTDSEKITKYLFENDHLIPDLMERLKKHEEAKETFLIWHIRNIPTKLRAQFKSVCAKNKKSMRDIIISKMREYIKENN